MTTKKSTMKTILIIILCFSLASCSGWKRYYRIEQIKAAKISGANIGKLERTTPFYFDQLNASKGDYVVFKEGQFYIFTRQDLRKNYSKKK